MEWSGMKLHTKAWNLTLTLTLSVLEYDSIPFHLVLSVK